MKLWKLHTAWLVAATVPLAACTSETTEDTAPPMTPTTAITPTTTVTPTTAVAQASPVWPASGTVQAGTHRIAPSAWSFAGLTVTMPEGWETEYGPPTAIKHSGQDGELAFYFVTVDTIFSDPCTGEQLIEVGPSVDDFAMALVDQPLTMAVGPVDTTFGGLAAKRVDLTVPDDVDTAVCNAPGGLQIWYSRPADKYLVALGDGTVSVYIVDVNGERQVFYTQHRAGTTPGDLAEMQEVVRSIRIHS